MGLQKHLSHKFTMSAALPIGRNIRSLSQQSHLSRKVKKNNLSARGAGVSTSSTRGLSWPVWYHGVVQNHLVYHFSASKLCSFGMCMAILRYFTISPANPFKIWAPATVCMAGNSPYPTDPILEFVALLTRRFLGVPEYLVSFSGFTHKKSAENHWADLQCILSFFSTVLVPCGSEIRMATLAGQTFLSALKSEVFSMEDDPEDADETVSCSIDRLLNICCWETSS